MTVGRAVERTLAIIGALVLLAVAFQTIGGLIGCSGFREREALSRGRSICTALTDYRSKRGEYPSGIESLVEGGYLKAYASQDLFGRPYELVLGPADAAAVVSQGDPEIGVPITALCFGDEN